MKPDLEKAVPIAQAFSKLLHPFAEVVIHDLETDQIAAIYNPFSKRDIGDDSYLDRWDFTVDPKDNVIGPYDKINYDGRPLKCISVVIRNDDNKAMGFVCVNMDISCFNTYRDTLNLFLNNNDPHISDSKQGLFRDDVYERINSFVQEYCQNEQVAIEALTRDQKQRLTIQLKDIGAFQAKGVPQYLARVLGVSRATIYNYIKGQEDLS